MPHDDDAHDWDDETELKQVELLQAELRSVYAAFERVSAVAHALQAGLRGLLDALELPGHLGFNREHRRLVLREARTALRQASALLEEHGHGQD